MYRPGWSERSKLDVLYFYNCILRYTLPEQVRGIMVRLLDTFESILSWTLFVPLECPTLLLEGRFWSLPVKVPPP